MDVAGIKTLLSGDLFALLSRKLLTWRGEDFRLKMHLRSVITGLDSRKAEVGEANEKLNQKLTL